MKFSSNVNYNLAVFSAIEEIKKTLNDKSYIMKFYFTQERKTISYDDRCCKRKI